MTRRRERPAMGRLMIGFAACALIVNALAGDQGVAALLHAREQHRRLSTEISALRAENARLRERARALREDPAAIEAAARRDLGLLRPGEKVVVFR